MHRPFLLSRIVFRGVGEWQHAPQSSMQHSARQPMASMAQYTPGETATMLPLMVTVQTDVLYHMVAVATIACEEAQQRWQTDYGCCAHYPHHPKTTSAGVCTAFKNYLLWLLRPDLLSKLPQRWACAFVFPTSCRCYRHIQPALCAWLCMSLPSARSREQKGAPLPCGSCANQARSKCHGNPACWLPSDFSYS